MLLFSDLIMGSTYDYTAPLYLESGGRGGSSGRSREWNQPFISWNCFDSQIACEWCFLYL